MKRFLALLLCGTLIALLFGACSPGKDKKTESDPAAPESAEPTAAVSAGAVSEMGKAFDADIRDAGFDGVAYAELDGEPVYESSASRYTTDTVFRVASVSKQFTAAAILMLCEEGKMSVDDTIDTYFPEFYKHRRYMADGTPLSDETMKKLGENKVTVHHLLSMRSGIPDYLTLAKSGELSGETSYGVTLDISAENDSAKNRDALKTWMFTTELSLPDLTYDYSNSNYLLLGEIIEMVSGKPYEDFITERIIEPLGMKNTAFGEKTDVSALNFAQPDPAESDFVWLHLSGVRYGCGDMISTAPDLAIWARELMDGTDRKVLTDAVVKQMTTNYKNAGYGYGLAIDDNHKMVSHEGNLAPFRSILAVSPSKRFALVMLDNRLNTPLSALSAKLCGDFAKTIAG